MTVADVKLQVARKGTIEWVYISEMKVSPKAQRRFIQSHADTYAADFDIDKLGYPVVNERDDYFWLVDGQHRVEALKMLGYGDQQIECEVFVGLSEEEEAELFLGRDERRRIALFDKFKIGLVAGRTEEEGIARVVESVNLKISQDSTEGCISAVKALRDTYHLGGPSGLTRTLILLRDSYSGDPGAFKAELILGMGLVCQRYDGALNDTTVAARLGGVRGGTMPLVRKANAIKEKTGHLKADCVAAAIVETLNAGKGGKKLESWWK